MRKNETHQPLVLLCVNLVLDLLLPLLDPAVLVVRGVLQPLAPV